MKLIKQRYPEDCGVACLAMFLGRIYEAAESDVAHICQRRLPISGMNNVEIAKVIKFFNGEPMQVFTLLPEVPAIVSVPSLGKKKTFHFVYWDGKLIHDPSRHEIYQTKDFTKSMPMADSIVCKKVLESNFPHGLPSHFYNYFDWNYINK